MSVPKNDLSAEIVYRAMFAAARATAEAAWVADAAAREEEP